MPGFLLPIYDLINDSPLLGRSFAEINAGGFDAFVAHKISEEWTIRLFVTPSGRIFSFVL